MELDEYFPKDIKEKNEIIDFSEYPLTMSNENEVNRYVCRENRYSFR